MRNALAASYRLRPDGRFLRAYGELDALLQGVPIASATPLFQQGAWRIDHRGAEVGTVPELPSFSDLMTPLARYAETLVAARAIPEGGAEPPGARDAGLASCISQLTRVDESWRKDGPSRSLARQAATGLTCLALQALDEVEVGDLIPSRALAFLALARAGRKGEGVREEALLAFSMGYTRHAADLAASLSATDPVRYFLQLDDAALEAAATTAAAASRSPDPDGRHSPNAAATTGTSASRQGATYEARYLYLRRVASRNDLSAWTSARTRVFFGDASLAPLLTGAAMRVPRQHESEEGQFGVFNEVYAAIHRQLLADSGLRPEGPRVGASDQAGGVLPFEATLRKGPAPAGPAWDAAAREAYYRSAWYSIAHHARWPTGEESDVARALSRWNALFSGGKSEVLRFLLDGENGKALGGLPLIADVNSVRNTVYQNPGEALALGRSLAQRLDSRLAHRAGLAVYLRYQISDSQAASRLYSSLLANVWEADVQLRGKALLYAGDFPAVKALLRSRHTTPDDAAEILLYWKYSGESLDGLDDEYAALVDRYPDSWTATSYYVDLLRARRKYSRACRLVERWLSRSTPESVGYYHAHIRLCRNYLLAGEYENGVRILSPVGQDYFKKREVSRCLNRLGRTGEAERMAKEATEAIPADPETRASYASLLWENGKDEEAAEALARGGPLSMDGWGFAADALRLAFEKRGLEQVPAAIGALRAKHFRVEELSLLARPFSSAGDHATAFAILSSLQPPGSAHESLVIEAYRELKELKGRAEAGAWIRKLVPKEMRNPLSVKAVYSREYDLLWELIETPDPANHPEWVWVMRAAASALQGDGDPHRKELLTYYEKPQDEPYHQMGRYLLGLSSEKDMLALATTPGLRCAVAYYLGVRAHGEGRYEDAAAWYRVAQETNQQEMGTHMSWRTLQTTWRAYEIGFEQVKAKRL